MQHDTLTDYLKFVHKSLLGTMMNQLFNVSPEIQQNEQKKDIMRIRESGQINNESDDSDPEESQNPDEIQLSKEQAY